MMTEITTAISTVGFPIVMCGCLCYYIYKVQSALVEAINKNSEAIVEMADALKGGVKDGEEEENQSTK